MGEGYPILGSAVLAHALPLLLLLVALGKLLSSGLTVGSGGSAGLFAPSMVIGGCMGGLAAIGLGSLGYADGSPKAYVLAGMAAFFAAGTACPLASLIIITEVAQGYHLLPALMWVVALGYLLGPKPGLFTAQVKGSADSPVHQAELESAFLSSRRVGQLCRWAASAPKSGPRRTVGKTVPIRMRPAGPHLSPDQGLAEALERLDASGKSELPVWNALGQVVGVFGYRDLISRERSAPP